METMLMLSTKNSTDKLLNFREIGNKGELDLWEESWEWLWCGIIGDMRSLWLLLNLIEFKLFKKNNQLATMNIIKFKWEWVKNPSKE